MKFNPFGNNPASAAAPDGDGIKIGESKAASPFGTTDYSNARESVETGGLPALVAQRLTTINAKAAAAVDTWSTQQRLMDELQAAKTRLGLYEAKYREAADPKQTAEMRADIDTAAHAIREFQVQTAPLVAVGRAAEATAKSLNAFANRTRSSGQTLELVPVKTKGLDRDAVESRMREIGHEIEEVEAAPAPLDTLIRQARDEVARMARLGEPVASVGQEHGASLRRDYVFSKLRVTFPRAKVEAAPFFENQRDLPTAPDGVALMCWLFEEQIADKLEADLEEAFEEYSGPAFTPEDRRKRVRELREEKLLRERELAALIWEDGGDLIFPEGMSPEAILGVRVIES